MEIRDCLSPTGFCKGYLLLYGLKCIGGYTKFVMHGQCNAELIYLFIMNFEYTNIKNRKII